MGVRNAASQGSMDPCRKVHFRYMWFYRTCNDVGQYGFTSVSVLQVYVRVLRNTVKSGSMGSRWQIGAGVVKVVIQCSMGSRWQVDVRYIRLHKMRWVWTTWLSVDKHVSGTRRGTEECVECWAVWVYASKYTSYHH